MRRRHVIAFANGPEERVAAMRQDLRQILPGFEHHCVAHDSWFSLMERFPPFTVAHTAALLGPGTDAHLRGLALALAPTRMLAYAPNGERFHLHPKQPLASLLFWRGWDVDKIHWRPWRDDSQHFPEPSVHTGKAPVSGLPHVAILSPYLPWPLSHGAAVRIYSLLQRTSSHANIKLYAFLEEHESAALDALLEHCTQITLVRKPKCTRWPWASLLPFPVHEFETPAMRRAWSQESSALRQIEFTQLATYGGDILVEHDITQDLAHQEYLRQPSLAQWWDWQRWRRFENWQCRRFPSVVVMSDKDRIQLEHPAITVLPNGVDLARFAAHPEPPGQKLLFIGSFRHFPNALAYRFLAEEFWPAFSAQHPEARLEVVAGKNPALFYPFGEIPRPPGILLHDFVEGVERLYAQANLVLIPTPVSAGTNIKALEAMASARAILSTPSGVHGLGLVDQESVYIAEGRDAFLCGASRLLNDPAYRARLAAQALVVAQRDFSWDQIAQAQLRLWKQLPL